MLIEKTGSNLDLIKNIADLSAMTNCVINLSTIISSNMFRYFLINKQYFYYIHILYPEILSDKF